MPYDRPSPVPRDFSQEAWLDEPFPLLALGAAGCALPAVPVSLIIAESALPLFHAGIVLLGAIFLAERVGFPTGHSFSSDIDSGRKQWLP